MIIKKVIIWGHKLHDHTHSYIHNGLTIGFKNLGYDTYWFDDEIENVRKIDFSNSLIISHGSTTNFLPITQDSIYILHNTDLKYIDNTVELIPRKYYCEIDKGIPKENIINLQVYTKDCINRDKRFKNLLFHYYLPPPHAIIYMPWATDLLPSQIDENIKNLENIMSKSNLSNPKINLVGMMTNEWGLVSQYSKKNNIIFNANGSSFNLESDKNKTTEENMRLIQESIIAPAIQTKWQVDHNYIPCRIFKNISYGKMGLTNNPAVNELFNNKLIYNSDINHVLTDGINFEKNNDKYKFEKIKELMIEVRDNHTYINRVNFILDYLKEFKNIKVTKI
jgi:hypothetical protein